MNSNDLPPVTIITPTTHERGKFNALCAQYGAYQSYKGEISHLFDYGGESIGFKRNRLVGAAKGRIIAHFDSDDFYARDWVEKSVGFLLSSGREVTGLDKAYFLHGNGKLQEYRYRGSQYYAIGATLCYTKEAWAKGGFKDTSNGEDTLFLKNKNIQPHQCTDGFCATVHGRNASGGGKYYGPSFSPAKKEAAQHIMGGFYKEYVEY